MIILAIIMAKEVYSVPSMMTNVGDAKRYIDDGSGFFLGETANSLTNG